MVLANRDEIQQVILNLVINAQHAMVDANGGGVLTIRTLTSGDQAVVEIADNGPGISPEFAGRVFEPFFTTKTVGRPGRASGCRWRSASRTRMAARSSSCRPIGAPASASRCRAPASRGRRIFIQ